MPHKSVPVKEEFDNGQGQLLNYDAYDQSQRFAVPRQKHVDLRTFENDPIVTRAIMLHFNQFTLNDLSGDTRTMVDLESNVAVRPGEGWTLGTLGKQADRHNWNGIEIECAADVTTVTSSVIPKVTA
jgi:hypothetical protein